MVFSYCFICLFTIFPVFTNAVKIEKSRIDPLDKECSNSLFGYGLNCKSIDPQQYINSLFEDFGILEQMTEKKDQWVNDFSKFKEVYSEDLLKKKDQFIRWVYEMNLDY